jgi:chromosome segregation ATPase
MVSVSKNESVNKKNMNKKGTGGGGGGGGCCGMSYCCLLFLFVAGLIGTVLVLDAYEYISVKVARDARVTLYAKMKELDPAIIEQQIGMKILNMEDYNKMVQDAAATKTQLDTLSSEMASTKTELESARQTIVEKDTAISTLTSERDGLQGQVTSMMTERDGLSQQVATVNGEKAELANQVAALTTERDALTTERDALKTALANVAAAKPENKYETEDNTADKAATPQVRRKLLKSP